MPSTLGISISIQSQQSAEINPSLTDIRIIEDGNRRVTEDGQKRETE